MQSWRRVLIVGGRFAALCVARDMNMFLARGFTIVVFLYPLRCMGLNFDWPDVLLTWVAGLRAMGLSVHFSAKEGHPFEKTGHRFMFTWKAPVL